MSSAIELKKQVVAEIADKFRASKATVIVDYHGLNVAEMTELRKQLREAGVEFKVYKYTLTRRALADVGLEGLDEVSVFVFDSTDDDDQIYTAFEGYTTNLLKLIGANNILSGKGVDATWDYANWEEVIASNPEYIIICDYSVSIRNTDDFDEKVAKLKENPALADIDAVKNDNFVRVRLSEITPGVRSVDALVRLAEEIHGVQLEEADEAA